MRRFLAHKIRKTKSKVNGVNLDLYYWTNICWENCGFSAVIFLNEHPHCLKFLIYRTCASSLVCNTICSHLILCCINARINVTINRYIIKWHLIKLRHASQGPCNWKMFAYTWTFTTYTIFYAYLRGLQYIT